MDFQYTNELINSSSPYLLQHAHNPVNWIPWDDELVRKGDLSDKLLLVSIGYAACHWCHVMEKESFENEDVAAIMNEYFICIKVDREERPDVDNFYMTAIHLMGLHGGWPLNIIALPDGRPIWGGTYFPKKNWLDNILAVADYWDKNKEQTIVFAQNLQEGIEASVLDVKTITHTSLRSEVVDSGVEKWRKIFDFENGGRIGQPKFPMPVNIDFLLYYGHIKKDQGILDFVKLTMQKMAMGGIYDQIGGGFARYATDDKWKIPHFEKMLYDNGQLMSLYSNGYRKFRLEDFKTVVYETTSFVERELMSPEGAFYSSLDADSEGEEGKYYVWSNSELKRLLGDDFDLFSKYYNINPKGLWEDGKYILLRDMSPQEFTTRHEILPEVFSEQLRKWKELLLTERNERVRPGLDDKTLLSWNAIVVKGLVDAYKAFGDNYFKNLAIKNALFLKNNMVQSGGAVYHTWKNGQSSIDGFLEDYALLIQATLGLFEITGEDKWLEFATQLLDFTIDNFYDSSIGLFYYARKEPKPAVTNHFQTEDNVVPASNSIMAHNLHMLYLIQANTEYREMEERMTMQKIPHFQEYPYAFANWGNLMLKHTEPFYEVAVCDEDSELKLKELQTLYFPNVLWTFTTRESNVPLLKNKYIEGESLIYVCENGSCKYPVTEVSKVLKQLGYV
ncbi:MAG TPA: thioredoxin domain-containing protein [Mariniphaga sp.]|nr:thioredoxin domain-containing protein [Mariniphaga sp.]